MAISLSAQEPSPPARDPADNFRLRVRVELVSTPLVARDSLGEFIYDLSREDIRVLDNGVPQQLLTFELATQPLSLVILVDTARKVAPLLDSVRTSGVLFTDMLLGQLGEAAIVTFDDEVRVRQGFTEDKDAIIKTLKEIPAGGRRTRLADALDHAVSMLVERPEGRRPVIVLFTEPSDKDSELPLGVPLRRAQLHEISVYTIALSPVLADLKRKPEDTPVARSPFPPGVMPGPGVPGQIQTPTTQAQQRYARIDLLSAIAAAVHSLRAPFGHNVLELYSQGTGGLHYAPRSRSALEESIVQIGQDLHNQYLLSYRPSNKDEQGFHRIEVRVGRRGARVRTRPGYYVGPPPES
ncbi:MAG: VWA domain-containing protein [Terriglobia bacterium]